MATKKTKGAAPASETGTLFAAAASSKQKAPAASPANETGTLFASSGGKKKKKPKPAKVRSMLLSSETGTLFAAVSGTICLEPGESTKVKLKLTKDKKGNIVIKVAD